jgi:hypothetical protein
MKFLYHFIASEKLVGTLSKNLLMDNKKNNHKLWTIVVTSFLFKENFVVC